VDNGAHYYRVDFQIHTPRDPNWHGADAADHEARLRYADNFIKLCRHRELDAIAITEHHDMCLAPYVQAAAQGEQYDPNADMILRPLDQTPLVFPGMELTVRQGCQLIVLLDPISGVQRQDLLFTALCGRPPERAASKNASVSQLAFASPAEVEERLRDTDDLKDQYVLLPNVNDGGQHTWLRRGFSQIYAAMPCIGGYVDGDLRGHGRIERLEGGDPNWGSKAIALFQTTDFRGWGMLANQEEVLDPDDKTRRFLGSCLTWVKLGAPTIEAVRQACLGRQSRIRQSAPVLPSTFIQRVEVSDSAFLGAIDLHLSSQLNALIGGRGTGKTSILEYVRFAMQDQPHSDRDDPSLHDEIAQKRERIVKDTLISRDADVTVHWMKNGVPHIVRYGATVRAPSLQIGQEDPQEVSPEELRAILPLQAYSQKQLSTVGTRTQELQRLVRQPLQEQLAAYSEKVTEKRRQAEQLYDRVVELKESSRALAAKGRELKSVQEQAKATEDSLPELSDELQKAMKEHPLRLREKQAIERFGSELATMDGALSDALAEMATIPHKIELAEACPQRDQVIKIHDLVEAVAKKVKTGIQELQEGTVGDAAAINDEVSAWTKLHASHEELYKKAEEEAKEHRAKLDLIKKLRTQEAALQKEIEGLEERVAALAKLNESFRKAWSEWVALHKGHGDLLEGACKELAGKSGGEIEVELQRGADCEQALQSLVEVLRGCNIREDRWDALRRKLRCPNPAQAWKVLMTELRQLAEMHEDDIASDDNIPELPSWDLTPSMRRRVVERLSPPRRWLDVALTSLQDRPDFWYRPKDGNRMEFRNASAGQQATALLKVLLSESSGPLLIDQPEEDLDNAIIQEITEVIGEAKTRRQLIFASHNANIVVNGDAELVVHCDYRKEGDKTKGHIAAEGAIDRLTIRNAIKSVMEGGEKAFQLRRQKYGF
jgi:putative AbiEii toxin of type IV toxin-antitoxin system/AAA domain-containing protein